MLEQLKIYIVMTIARNKEQKFDKMSNFYNYFDKCMSM